MSKCVLGNPAASVWGWSDGEPSALIGRLSGSSTLNWKIIVAFPATDYAGFILTSIYLTVAIVVIMILVLASMLLTVHQMSNPLRSITGTQEEDNIFKKGLNVMMASMDRVEHAMTTSLENAATYITSIAAYEDSADLEDSADAKAGIETTPLHKYQSRQIERIYFVVRISVGMWMFLWIWWSVLHYTDSTETATDRQIVTEARKQSTVLQQQSTVLQQLSTVLKQQSTALK